MKKLILSLAALLTFTLNANVMAAPLTGKIIDSNGYMQYLLNSNGKTYTLDFDRPVELKPQQTVELNGQLIDGNKISVDEVIVLKHNI